MRSFYICVALLLGCTKPNPNVCCTDEADCNAKGIPVGSLCGAGLVCRGNQCIAQPCRSGTDCDPAAPYCVADRCAENCVTDAECPGFGDDAVNRFCVNGGCVSCREGTDCGGSSPVCDHNMCRGCAHRDECASGVCGSDGACVDASQIAFVSPTGSPNTDCTQAMPCTIPRAVALTGLKYILIGPGEYVNSATIDVGGVRWIVGKGSTRPRITNSVAGPIFRVLANSDTRWENLEIYGARNVSPNRPYGSSLDAYDSGVGTRTLQLIDLLLSDYEYTGLDCNACTATVKRSVFRSSPGNGINGSNASLTVDSSSFSGNNIGISLFNGVHTITNSFFVRNTEVGIEFCRSSTLSARIEFSTIADNGAAAIRSCSEAQPVFQNDLIARNPMLVSGTLTTATYPGTLITSDVAAVKFKSPDAQPYDYHITAGSSAIDQAVMSMVDHDIDGQARPMGPAADVGADELQ